MRIRIQGLGDQKLLNFTILQICYLMPSMKDVQATGEAKGPQKGTSNTFIILWVIFALLDPDQLTKINANRIHSTTLQ
jgi:hypothetical protein